MFVFYFDNFADCESATTVPKCEYKEFTKYLDIYCKQNELEILKTLHAEWYKCKDYKKYLIVAYVIDKQGMKFYCTIIIVIEHFKGTTLLTFNGKKH